MKERASCRHLTHKHPVFLGCTLGELMLIVTVYLAIDLVVSIILSLFWGLFFLFMVGTFLISIILIKQTAKIVGRLKENKPAGYLILKLRYWLHQKFGLSIPFIVRTGRWKTRRSLR